MRCTLAAPPRRPVLVEGERGSLDRAPLDPRPFEESSTPLSHAAFRDSFL